MEEKVEDRNVSFTVTTMESPLQPRTLVVEYWDTPCETRFVEMNFQLASQPKTSIVRGETRSEGKFVFVTFGSKEEEKEEPTQDANTFDEK